MFSSCCSQPTSSCQITSQISLKCSASRVLKKLFSDKSWISSKMPRKTLKINKISFSCNCRTFFYLLFSLNFINHHFLKTFKLLIWPHIEIAFLILRNEFSIRIYYKLCEWNAAWNGLQKGVNLVSTEFVVERWAKHIKQHVNASPWKFLFLI